MDYIWTKNEKLLTPGSAAYTQVWFIIVKLLYLVQVVGGKLAQVAPGAAEDTSLLWSVDMCGLCLPGTALFILTQSVQEETARAGSATRAGWVTRTVGGPGWFQAWQVLEEADRRAGVLGAQVRCAVCLSTVLWALCCQCSFV